MHYPHYKACTQDAADLFKEHELDTSFIPVKKKPDEDFGGKKPIWFMWYQGWAKAPMIIKICYNALVDKIPEGTVLIFLDQDNLWDYIEIPEETRNAIKNNFTMLSNLIRTNLLYCYGGLWIDSTYLVVKDLPEYVFEGDFWSIKEIFRSGKEEDEDVMNFAYNLIYSKPGNEMLLYIYQALCTYWKYNNHVKHYLLTGGIINYGYNNNCFPKKYIDNLKTTINPRRYIFYSNYLCHYYSDKDFERISKHTWGFKVTYKFNVLFDEIKGKQTYYGYLKNRYLNRGIKLDDQRRNENERRARKSSETL